MPESTNSPEELNSPAEVYSPAEVNELNNARKQLGCQLISTTYEELKLWAAPYCGYRSAMRKEVQIADFKSTSVFEIYFFFLGWEEEPSAIATIVEEFELDPKLLTIVTIVTPLIKEALIQLNACRESMGHIPFDI
jgi:hypothetical protein